MGLLDLLSYIGEGLSADREEGPDPAAFETMVENAASDTVSAETLAGTNDRTKLPVAEYLEDDEQPQYMLRAGEVIAVDAEDNVARKYPGLETVVVATDSRLLIVIGGHVADDLMEIPYEDVVDVEVEFERYRRYLVVGANSDDERMTFSVDVTLEADEDATLSLVESLQTGGPDS
ncbi:MAG: hypothetical protein ABEJ68_10770 [Halobacteriaceae archaeon]